MDDEKFFDTEVENNLTIPAKTEYLDEVLYAIESYLSDYDINKKIMIQLNIAIEEIFVNIAHYAYPDTENGKAVIKYSYNPETNIIKIIFIDNGIPYNPVEKEDPIIKTDIDSRKIGGLGIYMVKKSMDEVLYTYENNYNILTIIKSAN